VADYADSRQGRLLLSLALTEPDETEDVAGFGTCAVPRGGGWLLNGRKCFVSGAAAANLILGSFQAVQHKCADMLIDLDTSRELTYEAVGCLSEHRPAAVGLARAGGHVPEAVKRIILTAHQLHGEIGYALEHDLHLYSNRVRGAELMLGTPSDHRALLAPLIGLRPCHAG
jgi:alkylation response protein AidB-like acyl-CoA dehydrogenase